MKVKMPEVLAPDTDESFSTDSESGLVNGYKMDTSDDEKWIEVGRKWREGILGDVKARHKALMLDADKLDAICAKTRETYQHFLSVDMVKESIYGDDGVNHGDCGEHLFIRCGRVAGRCTELAKKAIRWSHVLMGSRADASVTDLAQTLAEDLRMKEHAIGTLIGYNRLYEQVQKHNALCWGRARNAVEDHEKAVAKMLGQPPPDHSKIPRSKKNWVDELSHPLEIPPESDSEETKEKKRRGIVEKDGVTFEEYYANAMINLFGDELAEWQKEDAGKTDVSLIMRAIQSGADVIPTLQKELMMQYESLGDLKDLKSGGGEALQRNQMGDVEGDVDMDDADDTAGDGDRDGSGSELSGLGSDDERLATKKRKAGEEDEEAEILKAMGAGSTYSYSGDSDDIDDDDGDDSGDGDDGGDSDDDGGDSDEGDEEEQSDPDDAVDYAVTPMAH